MSKRDEDAQDRFVAIAERTRVLLQPVLRQLANEFEGGDEALIDITLALVMVAATHARGVGVDGEDYERAAIDLMRQLFDLPDSAMNFAIPRNPDGSAPRHWIFLNEAACALWRAEGAEGERLRSAVHAAAQERTRITGLETRVLDLDNEVLYTAMPKANGNE